MSRYCWEKGAIKLPTAEWKRVRDAIAGVFNKQQEAAYALAVEVHSKLLAIKAAGGSKALKQSAYDTLSADAANERLITRVHDSHATYTILQAVQKVDEATGKVTLTVPKKKDFPLAVSTKHTTYPVGNEGRITVDHATRTITWAVPENNHAVEHARETEMGKAFFRLMASVKWTRGTGGTLAGNDELNCDSRSEGDAANYVTARFGPEGAKSDPLARLRKAAGGTRRGRIGTGRHL